MQKYILKLIAQIEEEIEDTHNTFKTNSFLRFLNVLFLKLLFCGRKLFPF